VLAGLAIAGAVACAALLAVAIHSVGGHHRDLIAIAGPIISGAFVATGLRAWYTRPENRFGALMVALGFTYCLSGLIVTTDSWPFIAGLTLIAVPYALLVHILLSFPSGRLLDPLNRAVAGVMWALATVGWWACLVLEDTTQIGVPANPLLLADEPELFVTLTRARSGAVAALIAVVLVMLAGRWRASTESQRRAAAPVYLSGGLVLALYGVWAAFGAAGGSQDLLETLERARVIALAAVPFAFLAGLVRSRVAGAAALRGLVERLGERTSSLRDDLAQALGDHSLQLAYWLPERRAWVDAAGADVDLDPGRAHTPVERDGEPVAMIVSDPSAVEDRELVQAVGGAAALALENERLAAELRANLAELQASRARIVESADAARRKIERDLHDGAQQQLVAVALQLRAARTRMQKDPSSGAELVDAAAQHLDTAIAELRELARGIHPAVLTDRGLTSALQALATRMPLPVEIDQSPEERLPANVEAAAYFVVAEAVTNVAKYAGADHASVAVTQLDGHVTVRVSDDGVGGADPKGGSGLRGLGDRVAALGGRLEVESPSGAGTTVRAVIPVHQST
jgi:signal transduction histidine kinase